MICQLHVCVNQIMAFFCALYTQIDHKKGECSCDAYLKVPATQEDIDRNLMLVNNKQPIQSGALSWNQSDRFQISTLICSTKLTHNGKY